MEKLLEKSEQSGALSLTLDEQMQIADAALEMLGDVAFAGATLTRTKLGASSSLCVIMDALLSYHAQATGVRSRLRYWMAMNDYASGHTTKQVLATYTLGSVLLRELIDTLFLACDASTEVEAWIVDHGMEKDAGLYAG